jgi:hypothetical protein
MSDMDATPRAGFDPIAAERFLAAANPTLAACGFGRLRYDATADVFYAQKHVRRRLVEISMSADAGVLVADRSEGDFNPLAVDGDVMRYANAAAIALAAVA